MLSRSAVYAVRALTHLARTSPDGWSLNREIASAVDLPAQFLTKILRTLAEHGLLESQRGKSGGFRLAHSPDRITLLEIVDPFDHSLRGDACVLGQGICSDDHACPLHAQWRKISLRFSRILDRTTLAEIADRSGDVGFPLPVRAPRRESRKARATGPAEGRTNGAKRKRPR
jgi:Rrf2 family protein